MVRNLNLDKPMIVYIIGMSLKRTHIIFQTQEWEVFTFFKSEFLPVHLILLNSMCLYDLLCGSLELIKYDISFMVLHFFENIHLLLVLTYLVRYLELPLITIFSSDMLTIV